MIRAKLQLFLGAAYLLSLTDLAIAGQLFVEDVSCVATSRQVPGYLDEKFLVSDDGMTESPPGSGVWVVSRKARAWNSNYGVVGGRNDESPIVEFRFPETNNVKGMIVWNMPSPRGFQTVSVQYAENDSDWQFLPKPFEFKAANVEGDISGQTILFSEVVRASRIRLWCHATHRGRYGQPDVAGLYRVRFLKSSEPRVAKSEALPSRFPPDAGLVNVKAAPYFAKGDGQADDTKAIQQAMTDCQATRQAVYLPAGTYMISETLSFKPGYFHGDNNVRGDGVGRTILRLKDNTFSSKDTPQPLITFGFHGPPEGRVSADWFNNNIRDLTIDVGRNAGAIGLQFYSNNAGAARNLEIRAAEGCGVIGLDLGYKDQNGPLLVKDLTIEGFEIGVSTGNSVNSQILSGLVLESQRELAVRNTGQCLTIEKLNATGASPRIENKWGFLTLIDSSLAASPAVQEAGVTNGEYLCAVNLETSGFESSISSTHPEAKTINDRKVHQFFSGAVAGKQMPAKARHLERTSTPEVGLTRDTKWVNVRNFRRIDEIDDSAAFQRAIDSGAKVVYFPAVGSFTVNSTITIRGNVTHILGFQSQLQTRKSTRPAFRIESAKHPTIVLQDLIDLGFVENVSDRTVVIKDIQGIDGRLQGGGDVFLENTVGEFEVGPKQKVWSRQMNSERAGTKLINRGGQLVVIGLKTERGGTLVETTDGGRTEVMGGLCYTTNRGELAPMFVNQNSSVWAAIGEVCYTGNPFQVLVSEQRGDSVRTWKRGDAPLRFKFLQGSALMYDGRETGGTP